MNLTDDIDKLFLTCSHCASWYSHDSAPHKECVEYEEGRFKHVYHCDCTDAVGNRVKLDDAHEIGVRTPATQERYDELMAEYRRLTRRVLEIEKEIRNMPD